MIKAEKVSLGREYKKESQIKSIWKRYKKSKLAVTGLIMLILLILIAIVAPLVLDYQQDVIKQTMPDRLQAPSREHLFGTDHFGRDVFNRVLYGTRISLFIGLAAVIGGSVVGIILGLIAGYYGGKIESVLMRLMDILLAIPSILLAITIVAALGKGLLNLLLAMSIAYIPVFSRIVRSSALSIKHQEFIEAAVACGTKDSRIMFRHILPNAMGPIIVQMTLGVARAIINISSLSFIGLGVQAPMPEWGSMLAEGKSYMVSHPYLVILPGIAIVISVMALNLIGDGLRDALDPKLKN